MEKTRPRLPSLLRRSKCLTLMTVRHHNVSFLIKNNLKFHSENDEKQTVPSKSTNEGVLFEWSDHRISSTDSKVRKVLQN